MTNTKRALRVAARADESELTMVERSRVPSRERVAMLGWTAGIGAVTAEALAQLQGASIASARARLSAAVDEGLLSRHRLLTGQPALYSVTRAGLRATGLSGLDPCRVSAASSQHLIACAHAAAALQRCYPDHTLMGERELRREEHQAGAPVASAVLGRAADDRPLLHRPDVVLWPPTTWPRRAEAERPIAVEVELTIKAPRRLADICRAWARSRLVAGVLYLAAPEVEGALERALATARADERIVVVPLDALPDAAVPSRGPREPSQVIPSVPSGGSTN
jgi:hypothetical protein